VPQTKETPSTADKNAAESSEKKQQVAAVPKASPAAKTNSKVSGVTNAAKTSVVSSTAEILKVPMDNDATGKTEVNEYCCYNLFNMMNIFYLICFFMMLPVAQTV
jgi:hypothetical protein